MKHTRKFSPVLICRSLLSITLVTAGFASSLATAQQNSAETSATFTLTDNIDFGDNSSMWSGDGECDDPRFQGEGMAATTIEDDALHDANDCRSLFESGLISLGIPGAPASTIDLWADSFPGGNVISGDIEFGDDNGEWANDGECDDPRFQGDGMASLTFEEDSMHDATDCLGLYQAGEISLAASAANDWSAAAAVIPSEAEIASVEFGDDSSIWSDDNECDDPRFTGQGMARVVYDEDLLHDGSDCLRLFSNGSISLLETPTN